VNTQEMNEKQRLGTEDKRKRRISGLQKQQLLWGYRGGCRKLKTNGILLLQPCGVLWSSWGCYLVNANGVADWGEKRVHDVLGTRIIKNQSALGDNFKNKKIIKLGGGQI